MRDYVSREGLSKEETELNMTIVTSADPLSYEKAVKSYNWREVWMLKYSQFRGMKHEV
jgi:hypothetical protein